jgi:glycosyltransferase involved in cell wall biosynthesis
MRSGLLRFLIEHRDVRLTLLGPLTPPAELVALEQVRLVTKLPMHELDEFVAQHDVCLVPLEPTLFNDCKSALKFLECGLVSVPVIASPRREFAEAVQSGENGLLVEHECGWYAALRDLRRSPELLRRLAAGAHASVVARHTVASRGAQLGSYLASLVASQAHLPAAPVPALPAGLLDGPRP